MSVADGLIAVKAARNNMEQTRVGYSVTKNVGKATVRNHVKRLLKENVRLLDLKAGWDIVFIARRNIVTADFHEIGRSVVRLLRRAGLMADGIEKTGAQVN